jgi:uncharacterized paraquat-inducible protein A
MTDPSTKSFCPHCQADWDQPWYDVCPACNYKFTGHSRWQSPWLILAMVLAPAVAVLAAGLIPRQMLQHVWQQDRDGLLFTLTTAGSAVAAIPAGILASCRLARGTGGRVLYSLIFIPVFYVVSFILCFFTCVGASRN